MDENFSQKANQKAMENGRVYLPGERICDISDLIAGNGVYEKDDVIYSATYGRLKQIDSLITVEPLNTFYIPQKGDCVIGKIESIYSRLWKVDIGASIKATLKLSSIYLPDREQRRRNIDDEKNMRSFFDVGDLVYAYVLSSSTNEIEISTRERTSTPLTNGVLVTCSISRLKFAETHDLYIDCMGCIFGLTVGLNGRIWISPKTDDSSYDELTSLKAIQRVRNAIILLDTYKEEVSVRSIIDTLQKTRHLEARKIASAEGAKCL